MNNDHENECHELSTLLPVTPEELRRESAFKNGLLFTETAILEENIDLEGAGRSSPK